MVNVIVLYCGENEVILSNLKSFLQEELKEGKESYNGQDIRKIAFNQLTTKEQNNILGI